MPANDLGATPAAADGHHSLPNALVAGSRTDSPGGVLDQVVASTGGTASAGAMLALPWQTITAGEVPDVRSLAALGSPLVQRALRASLKQPAIALLMTTAIDVLVAVISGQGAAMQMVLFRAILGGATGAFGLAAGNKPGPMRKATGALSLVTALVQTSSMVFMLASGPDRGSSAIVLLPSLLAQASSLVLAVKAAVVSFRR